MSRVLIRVPDVTLRLGFLPICSMDPARIWIENEHAIAFAADTPVTEGHIIVMPRQHVATIFELIPPEQQGLWALLGEVRDRVRAGLVPDAGFSLGFVDGLSAAVPVAHTIVHVIPRRLGDNIVLPDGAEWIADDGILPSGRR